LATWEVKSFTVRSLFLFLFFWFCISSRYDDNFDGEMSFHEFLEHFEG
jgi:hypothetical protein